MKKVLLTLTLIFLLTSCDANEDITMELIPGQDTVEINTAWNDAGARVLIDGQPTIIKHNEFFDTSILGVYDVVYLYEYQDTVYEITRYVAVVDQTKPVITLHPGIDTLSLGDIWEDAGASVVDNSLEPLNITVSGTVDSATPGTYEITYTATDSSGNETTIIRFVDVLAED